MQHTTARKRAGIVERAGLVAARLSRSATMRSIPGGAGAVLVSIGLGQVYRPLYLIGMGAFLLLLDRRV